MRWRRITTAGGFVLLVLASLVVAEAALAVLLVLFSFVLRVNLTVQLAAAAVNAWLPMAGPYPDVTIYTGAALASFAFTAACGLGAGAHRFIRWQPRT